MPPDGPFATGPFGMPVNVPELNSDAEEDDVSLTDDMLEIYFMSLRTGSARLYRATRATIDDPWSPPVEVPEVHGGANQVNNPRVRGDGLAIYFASDRAGTSDLWLATRPDRSSAFSAPVLLPGLDSSLREFEPWPSRDELTMYMNFDGVLSVATRASTAEPFGAPTPLRELESSVYDGGMWLDPDELVVVFHSDRNSIRDIFIATRASKDVPFDPPLELDGVNVTNRSDSDAWLSPDGHVVYFVTTRDGNDDIFVATR